MQTKEFNYKGKKLVYRTAGTGPVVVLLHGFGEDGTVWKGQYDLFPRHQLLIPDLPGVVYLADAKVLLKRNLTLVMRGAAAREAKS